MTPSEEKTAGERDREPLLSMNEIRAEAHRRYRDAVSGRVRSVEAAIFIKGALWAEKELRLTNQRLEVENNTLRARTGDMKELEQALMMKETRIKELEAEVERMKRGFDCDFRDLLWWYSNTGENPIGTTIGEILPQFFKDRLRSLESRGEQR